MQNCNESPRFEPFGDLVLSFDSEVDALDFIIDTIVRLSLRAAQVQDEDQEDPHLFQSAEQIFACLRDYREYHYRQSESRMIQ